MQTGVAEQLGANIKAVRVAQKLTQEKLAEKIGKSIGLIGQIERGEAAPSVDTLVDIIRALGVSPNGILGNLFPDQPPASNEVIKVIAGMNRQQQQYVLDMVVRFSEYLHQSGE